MNYLMKVASYHFHVKNNMKIPTKAIVPQNIIHDNFILHEMLLNLA